MSLDEPDDEFDADDSLPLRELRRLTGGRCVECGTAYTAREVVGSVALGFKAAPRCHSCLSRRLGRDAEELRGELTAYVHRRECFLKAWREAPLRQAWIFLASQVIARTRQKITRKVWTKRT